jgi:CubicO group peptidase (beta-lactamase class C family)
MANLEYDVPNSAQTIFEAGSVSKQFTATGLILLAQRGRLSLDDDVRKYVPELPTYERTITLRHLLSHTSGLRDWGNVADIAGWPRTTRVHTHAHVLDILSRQKSLNYPVGDEYSYTNSGYNLAAIIIGRVSGMPFAEFERKEIFEPLGLTNTQWRDDYTRIVKNRATAYERSGASYRQDMPFENVYGNGGLLTTVGDLLKWNDALTKRTVPGGAGTVAELERRAVLTNGTTIAYAQGLRVEPYKGVMQISHSGSTAGYRAYLVRYPEQGLSVALLCNAGNANPTTLAHAVADIYLGSAVTVAPPKYASGVQVPSEVLARRAGLFRSTRTGEVLRLTARDGRLRGTDTTGLVALSATRFANRTGTLTADFELDAAGGTKVLRVVSDADTVTYVPAAAPMLGADDLAQYAGVYHSAEADATFTIAVKGNGLRLRARPDVDQELMPEYRDAFTANVGMVFFRRDASGRITALSIGNGRVRDMRFVRQ